MKRNISFIVLSTLVVTGSIFAAIDVAVGQGCFKPKMGIPPWKVMKKDYRPNAQKTATSTDVGFSFYNKSGQTVFIAVKNVSIEAGDKVGKALSWLTQTEWVVEVPNGQMANIELNTQYQTNLKILYNCTNKSCSLKMRNVKRSYTFRKNKTIYVTYNPNNRKNGKVFYPQSGPTMKGLVSPGITDVCYDLSNNIQPRDIIEIMQ